MVEAAGGPYVSVATLCDRVLTEQDGSISVIRAIQRTFAPVASGSGSAAPVVLTLLITLLSGAARGRESITIQTVQPSGLRGPSQSFDVFFEGEERGINLIVNPFVLSNPLEGLYWFEVRIGERMLTRIPLRVVYRQVLPPPIPPPSY